MINASLRNYRISPRKVRLVANLIRGKKVSDAESILAFTVKKAKNPLGDLLHSAIANAKNNFNLDKDSLYIKEIMVNQGYVLRRSMPVSHGSAHPIKKRTSHVMLVLAEKEGKPVKNKKEKKVKKKD